MTPQLTTAQLTALRNEITNSTDPEIVAARGNGANIGRDDTRLAAHFNGVSADRLWRPDAPAGDVLDSVDFTAFTPTDSPDITVMWTNRGGASQIKQRNLQMLTFRDQLDCTRARTRNGLLDAVTNLPTGVAGAAVSAGGANGQRTMTAISRLASRAERFFANPTPAVTGTVTGYLPTAYGLIDPSEIGRAMNNNG